MMKDNVYLLEKQLKDKIRIYFDKDLQDARVQLKEQRKMFDEYRVGVKAAMNNNLTNVVNNLDQEMKERFTTKQEASNYKYDASHVANELMNNYSHLFKKQKQAASSALSNMNPSSGAVNDFGGMK